MSEFSMDYAEKHPDEVNAWTEEFKRNIEKAFTYNQDKEDLDRAIELLEEALEGIKELAEFQDGWDSLGLDIAKYLNKLKENG